MVPENESICSRQQINILTRVRIASNFGMNSLDLTAAGAAKQFCATSNAKNMGSKHANKQGNTFSRSHQHSLRMQARRAARNSTVKFLQ